LCGGFEGCPVAAVVAGDVGAVGAYGDPGFGLCVVGYGAAVAVGWGLGFHYVEVGSKWKAKSVTVRKKDCSAVRVIGMFIVAAHNHELERRCDWALLRCYSKCSGRFASLFEWKINELCIIVAEGEVEIEMIQIAQAGMRAASHK
jgi:hypothetical protein